MQARLVRLRNRMRERGLDALVVSSLPNIRYLTGFSGSNALCIVTRRKAFFLTDSRYRQQSREEVIGYVRHVATAGLFDTTAELHLLSGYSAVGFEAHAVSYAQFRRLKRLVPGIHLKSTEDFVEDIAVCKDAGELSKISRAVRITDRVYGEVLQILTPGVSERDVAAEISYLHRKYGADGEAFEPIVAGGPRAALPHARPTARKFRRGETLVLDLGCVVEGYGSDLTRTVSIGSAPRRARSLYAAVLSAQNAAINAARPGLRARDLDGIARSAIVSAGYGKFFTHSLGHGLGLRVHERPWIAPKSVDVLAPGNVITIEPGIYIPGYGGIRIEDDVVITRTGCRVLTKAPKDFCVV